MQVRRITITTLRRPTQPTLNEELQWLGNSLGLFSERDRNKSCFRLFIELIKAIRKGENLTSDDLAERVGISRATVVHHLRALIERGIAIHQGNYYFIRADKLSTLIEDLQKDIERTLKEVKEAAEELDKLLEL